MAFMNRAINTLAQDVWAIFRHREEFVEHLRTQGPDLVRSFYVRLGARPGVRWGDKHPHYADPVLEPGCLDLIDEFFPTDQIVHIVRDGRDVAASILQRGWTDLDLALDVWQRCVSTARDFGLARGMDRYHELRYEDLVAHGPAVVDEVLGFLDVGRDRGVTAFLEEQARRRTPFSSPVSPREVIGASGWRRYFTEQQAARANDRLADLLVELRYESHEWRRRLPPLVR